MEPVPCWANSNIPPAPVMTAIPSSGELSSVCLGDAKAAKVLHVASQHLLVDLDGVLNIAHLHPIQCSLQSLCKIPSNPDSQRTRQPEKLNPQVYQISVGALHMNW